jgi:hypothetical protein
MAFIAYLVSRLRARRRESDVKKNPALLPGL